MNKTESEFKKDWKKYAKARLLESEDHHWHDPVYMAMNMFTDRLKYECMHAGGTLAQMYDAKNQYNV